MAVTKEQKEQIVKKFKTSDLDTGSANVQIALLTARINDLTTHFSKHKKDFHGRRGLVTLVNQRRKLLDYLHRKDVKAYQEVLKALDIRK
ncbi:30S ribosomal protein S15 [Bdellovibrio sp. NC01]|uniref:30S ribosomal protein S15 n=1 Tax=Bdellovibrio sp. NC01 TaxID=2220073 RepID=UPI001156F68E|nr:30S ribosomal protein S15 [Bdellovibrio sp. NC01]QDK37407.1 30S ribosomal protein S15 [Bdellovibrio sp. NC01]